MGVKLPDGAPACGLDGERLAREIRSTLADAGYPEVVSPARTVGVALRRLADGRRVLGLINYAHLPVAGIEVRGLNPGGELEIQALEQTRRLQADSAGRTRLPDLDVEMLLAIAPGAVQACPASPRA